MSKKNRLAVIKDIIEKYEIETQDELTQKLNEQGFDVSQATVSRDINDLGLIKCAGIDKRFKYCNRTTNNLENGGVAVNLFKQVVKSITQAENLIVIKTMSGSANSAGTIVDSIHLSQILGTIAGDDTLLVVTQNSVDAEFVVKNLGLL